MEVKKSSCNSYLKVNHQAWLAQLGLKAKGMEFFRDNERPLGRGKEDSLITDPATLRPQTGRRDPKINRGPEDFRMQQSTPEFKVPSS